jgi:AcrR family transcriptional regulator
MGKKQIDVMSPPSDNSRSIETGAFGRPAMGAQPIADPVLNAAASCIRRKGIDNVSLEEVAAEAGVSRTTLYRRFGNRESLFTALLMEGAKPFREWSHKILIGPGSVADRLETVLAHAILEMQHVGWLERSLHSGMSPASARLFRAAQADGSTGSIASVLASLIDERATAAGVTLDDLTGWITDQMIVLASGEMWDEERLRSRLRYFVMPVLTAACEPPVAAMHERLDAIERKIDILMEKGA